MKHYDRGEEASSTTTEKIMPRISNYISFNSAMAGNANRRKEHLAPRVS
jgi:hypothetical protein